MHFAFSDQQDEFRQAVRQVLANECTPEHLRTAYGAPAARTRRWSTLAGLGVTGLSAPEAHGGLGLGMVDLVRLVEEAGAVALPEPLTDTTALAAPLLVALEQDHRQDPYRASRLADWLEGIAAGTITVAVGPIPVGGSPTPIAGADGADLLILFSPVGAAHDTVSGAPGPEVHIVEAGAVTIRTVSSLDPTRRLGIPHWAATPETVMASGADAAVAIGALHDRAAVAVGAELLGLAATMIRLAADYAKDRRQFGVPIGSFQAVKHLLAGAQVTLEFARPLVYAAAWALDAGDPGASRSSSAAKAYAAEAAVEAARVSLQVFGAIGYTWECDLHLFLKRAWALAEAWGSASDHRMQVLESLVAESGANRS